MTSPNSPKIGRFSILKPLGRGLQGAVYLARDPDLDRLVAIKLVGESSLAPAGSDDGWPQARNLARLRHPNIIALHELGRFHSFTYLVFDYLEGRPLRLELDSSGALTLAETASVMLQLADAMAYAHARGILHLDLNPNNIMRDEEGKPHILDFDLSRRVGTHPRCEYVSGTLPYMAPEYFTTQVLDPRTDVYALGQILFEMLSGTPAVPDGDDDTMIASICGEEADFARLARADPTGAFTRVVRRATAKQPEARFAHARAMHEALRSAWETSSTQLGGNQAVIHGTVAFVLKRIERRGDFPAMSRTLAEINKLTGDDNQTPTSRLAGVILRDFAMANRLLKLANSAYYARTSGAVKTVSDAIDVLGVEQVRLTCNTLACFGHFSARSQDARLKEQSIASFIAGLLARHLAARMGSRETEAAFLAGMLFDLGKMLVLFYFPEDHAEIDELVAGGATPNEAARSVLGISLAELGHGLGKAWGLPAIVLDCMLESPANAEEGDGEALRRGVRFANMLADVDPARDPAGAALATHAAMLRPHIALGPEGIHALLKAAVEKFELFAPALEVDPRSSACVRRLWDWLRVNAGLRSRAAREAAKVA